MSAFPSESDLFPTGALAPATAKTKWQQFFQAVTGLLGTSGDAADARSALGALAKAGDTLAGLLKFAKGTDIASSATVNLSTATGNTVKITGTTGISAWTMTAGQVMDVIFAGALTLTHHATNNNLPGGANITTAAGDRARLYYDGTTVYVLSFARADGRSVIQSVLGTAQNTTSGTAIDFTGIPSWVKRITVQLNGVSTNGTAIPMLQLGTASGVDGAGYNNVGVQLTDSASVNAAAYAGGFQIRSAAANAVLSGAVTLSLMSAAGNTWVAFGAVSDSANGRGQLVSGSKSLAGALDRVRLTTGGSDTFDAGSINILYE